MLRSFLAGFVGLIVGCLLVSLVEYGNSLVYPFPPGLDMNNQAHIAQFITTLPVGAFVAVWFAWVLGAFVGTLITKVLTKSGSDVPAIAMAAIFALFCVFNMLMLPHPLAFVVASVIATPLAAFAGLKLGGKLSRAPAAAGAA